MIKYRIMLSRNMSWDPAFYETVVGSCYQDVYDIIDILYPRYFRRDLEVVGHSTDGMNYDAFYNYIFKKKNFLFENTLCDFRPIPDELKKFYNRDRFENYCFHSFGYFSTYHTLKKLVNELYVKDKYPDSYFDIRGSFNYISLYNDIKHTNGIIIKELCKDKPINLKYIKK